MRVHIYSGLRILQRKGRQNGLCWVKGNGWDQKRTRGNEGGQRGGGIWVVKGDKGAGVECYKEGLQ